MKALNADIVVLQECTRPDLEDARCRWLETPGANKRGIGVMASGDDWRLECAPIDGSAPHSIFPVKVSGPSSFHLLAIWAMRQPSYVGGILRGLDCYREFLQGAPSIVIGDFNSPGNDARSRSHHAALEDRLLTEFALMNAWRVYAERTGQPIDEPTYYLQRQNDRPFHIDYCFFPEAWASTLRSVEIGNYSDWATDSDHRPILVEFE